MKPLLVSLLAFAMLLSNIPLGFFETVFKVWKDGNVVDVVWQSIRDGSVVDSLKPRSAEAAPIAQYSGGLLVYADGTAGAVRYKTFDDTNGFGAEQSATAVGSAAIEWIRVAASPINDEWIIVTRDANDDIIAQVCTGVDGGVSCGATTSITATAGTHGLRNFDVAYEYSSGDALLVYGTATADELRKIEWTGGSWTNGVAITTTRTSGTVEWVELTSRGGTSDQIGIAYSDSNDDVSAYRWSGSSAADEATQAVTTAAPTGDVRKFDVSFEGTSGDMFVAAGSATTGQFFSATLVGTTWTFATQTATDFADFFIDIQEPGSSNYLVISSHESASSANDSEGFAWTGTGVTDGTAADDVVQNWAANYQLSAVSYFSSGTYYAVAVISNSSTADDIDWWTSSSTGGLTNRTVNSRTRGSARFIDLFDYPNVDKVLLLTVDANSDLWADTWDGVAVNASAWTDLTSGGALETALGSGLTDVVDFAFRLAATPVTIDVSGTCKQFDQTTDCTDSGTIAVAVNGTLQGQTQTTVAGTWTISGVTPPATSSVITVFVDGAATGSRAVAVSKYDGSGNITGVTLFERHLAIGSDDNQTATNGDLALYDNSVSGDANIFYDVDGSNNLNVDVNGQHTDERLMVRYGNTYQPSASSSVTITTHHFQASTSATVTANGNTFSVGGDWTNSGTFNEGTSTVVFVSSTTSTITGTTSWYNLTSTTSNKVLLFGTTSTHTINGTLTLTGASGSELQVRSNQSGTQWNINHQGAESVSFIRLQDSGCHASSTTITTSNSSNDGNNGSCWSFPNADLQQIHYRWRNDDGNEAGATFAAATDSTLSSWPKRTLIRLRTATSNGGAGTASNIQFRLEYGEKSTTCAAISSWTPLVNTGLASAQHWSLVNTSNIADGTVTTDNAGLPNENTTFVAGEFRSNTNLTNGISLTTTQFTELEWALWAENAAVSNSAYCFRATNNGSTQNFTFSVYPEISVKPGNSKGGGGGSSEGSSGGGSQTTGGTTQGGGGSSEGGGSGGGGSTGGGTTQGGGGEAP